jgi:hypothetical protein
MERFADYIEQIRGSGEAGKRLAGLGRSTIGRAMEIAETAARRRPAAAMFTVRVTVGATRMGTALIGHSTPPGMIDVVKRLSPQEMRDSMMSMMGDHGASSRHLWKLQDKAHPSEPGQTAPKHRRD